MTERPGRDRDGTGKARNARPRDSLGRPLPRPPAGSAPAGSAPAGSAPAGSGPAADSPPGAGGAPVIPEDLVLGPAAAAELGARLLADGHPFQAHEVFEAAWKSVPGPGRELWRGLAQVAVGITHARRGNRGGAVALLRRGAERVASFAGPSGGVDPGGLDPGGLDPGDIDLGNIDPGVVAAQASAIADRIERDGLAAVTDADLRLKLRP